MFQRVVAQVTVKRIDCGPDKIVLCLKHAPNAHAWRRVNAIANAMDAMLTI
jgi:hypothetical protein